MNEIERGLLATSMQHSTEAWRASQAVWDREYTRAMAQFPGDARGLDDEDAMGAKQEYALLIADNSNLWHEVRTLARRAEAQAYEVRFLLDGLSEPACEGTLALARDAVAAAGAAAARAVELASGIR